MTKKDSCAFISESPAMLKVIETAKKLKGHNAGVLITGESGTGKEILAHFIHGLEENSSRPFIPVHCGMFPDNLIESELFGHEEGAFTGAKERRIGRFEMANGGDVFLDEIGTLKPETQIKLLRVLQDKEIYRLGGKQAVPVNFRVIAATNENLEKLVEEGRFRLDLYHRLAVVQLHASPLRKRKEDIELLAEYFLKKFCNDSFISKKITPEALKILQEHDWPGNVRELENAIHSAVILSAEQEFIGLEAFEKQIKQCKRKGGFDGLDRSFFLPPLKPTLENYEKAFIKAALKLSQGNKADAARKLDIHRSTLYERIDSLCINEMEDTLE